MVKATKISVPKRDRETVPPAERTAKATVSDAAVRMQSAPPRGLARVFSSRRLLGAVVIAMLVEVALVVWVRTRPSAAAPPLPREIAIGTFEFTRSNSRDNQVYRGQFDLFVRPVDDLESDARQQFVEAQPQLPRAVEEAIRRVRATDFVDRRLTRLKDRIERQLNDELGFKGISEVLISNFTIKAEPIAASRTAGSTSE